MDIKKSISRFFSAFIVPLLLFAAAPVISVNAQSSLSDIEQIYIDLPEIRVYMSPMDELPKAEDITAKYKDKSLSCKEVKKYHEITEGTEYYVLLDISGSLSSSVFSDMKEGIKYLSVHMGDTDRLSLITFGDDVKTVYTSDKSRDELDKVLSGLKAENKNTALYQGLAEALKQSESSRCKRKECLLFTDGWDDTFGKVTLDEIKTKLNENNLPIYAVVDKTNKSEADKLGKLARDSDGDIYTLGSNNSSSSYVKKIMENVGYSTVLVFEAPDNNVYNYSTVKFSVTNNSDGAVEEKEVKLLHYKKDTTAPEIKSMELSEKNTLKVTFSKDVTGAGEAKNYSLIDSSKKSASPEKAVYEANGGEYTAVLTFKEEIVKDDYELVCRNITDNNTEHNLINKSISGYLDGVEPSEPENSSPDVTVVQVESFPLPAMIAVCVVIVLLVAGIVMLAVVRAKRNKLEQEQEQPVMPPPPPPHPETGAKLVSNAPHYEVAQVMPDKIKFLIEMNNKQGRTLEIEFSGKLYVGRGKDCDFVVEDKFMARKQFMIEKSGFIYTISDLNSTNGTFLNGVRISSTRRLSNHDVITAGRIRITVEI